MERITCPTCGRDTAAYATGRIYHHGTGARCSAGGNLPSDLITASITGSGITSTIDEVFEWVMSHVWDANLDAIYAELCSLSRRFAESGKTVHLGGSLTLTRH